MSWRRPSKGHITQTSTPERSWLRGQNSQRPEYRWDTQNKRELWCGMPACQFTHIIKTEYSIAESLTCIFPSFEASGPWDFCLHPNTYKGIAMHIIIIIIWIMNVRIIYIFYKNLLSGLRFNHCFKHNWTQANCKHSCRRRGSQCCTLFRLEQQKQFKRRQKALCLILWESKRCF